MTGDALREWFGGHMLEEILPRWLAAAPSPGGYFHAGLDRHWQRVPLAEATLVSQSRLLYNFSAGWRATGDPRYREAVAEGSRFLVAHLGDPVHPGWLWSVTDRGEPLDPGKDAYGHAFVIFGLAHAAQTLEDSALRDRALATRELMFTHFTDAHGGILPRLNRELTAPTADPRSQNPIMHLFEAHLALLERGAASPQVAAGAQELARFVHHRLGDARSGRLPEMYDADWRELPRERGGRVDLGHAAEWAFLLSRAVELGLPADWLGVGERLLARALEIGEAPGGGLQSNEAPEGGLLPGEMGNWQQCELIRALIHYAVRRGRDDLWPRVEKHLAFVQERFLDEEFGGWYFTPKQDGRPPTHSDKGSIWKLDYHVVGMCEEAVRQ